VVKDRAYVEEKMKERVRTAGTWLQRGMEQAEDPVEVLLKDPEGFAKKLVDGLMDAIRRGNYKIGLEKASKRGKWRSKIPLAARHFEEVADLMVEYALEDYEARAKCIEEARKAIAGMPKATRADRIKRSAAYQEKVAECFDRLYGRKP